MTLADLHEPLLPIFAELARWAGWPPGGRILDAGCGPGLKTDLLAQALNHTGIIIGLDWDTTLLHLANGPHSPLPHIWLAGDLHALPLADNSLDGVWCSATIGLLASPPLALVEMRRVLQPDSIALVATATQRWSAVHRWPPEVAAALETAYSRALATGLLTPPHSELGDELTAHLRDAGFAPTVCRAFLGAHPVPSPLLAELMLVPWAALCDLLRPLLNVETFALAEAHAAAPEDAEPIAVLVGARGNSTGVHGRNATMQRVYKSLCIVASRG